MRTKHPQNPTCGLLPARSPPAESSESIDESEGATLPPRFNAPSSTSALPVGRERRINSTKRRCANHPQNPTCGLFPARSPPAESRKPIDESGGATLPPGFNAPSSTSALHVGRERRINSTKRRHANRPPESNVLSFTGTFLGKNSESIDESEGAQILRQDSLGHLRPICASPTHQIQIRSTQPRLLARLQFSSKNQQNRFL